MSSIHMMLLLFRLASRTCPHPHVNTVDTYQHVLPSIQTFFSCHCVDFVLVLLITRTSIYNQ
ncbi:hypothetical protein M758_6G205000 [Ceratodon purpureus]|nr:hypothetical protein M758_6G205000 [Ceratodon purpureus]